MQGFLAGFLPAILLALIGGYILARLISAVASRLVKRQGWEDEVGERFGIEGKERVDRFVRRLVFYLVFLVAILLLFLASTGVGQVEQSLLIAEEYFSDVARQETLGLILRLVAILTVTIVLIRSTRRVNQSQATFQGWMETFRQRRIRRLKIQEQEIVSEAQLQGLVTFFARLLRFVVLASLILIYLLLIFTIFPFTRNFALSIWDQILAIIGGGLQAIINHIPDLLTLIVLFFFVRYFLRLLSFIFDGLESGTIKISSFYPDWAAPTYQLVRILVIILALVFAFPFLPGADSEGFRTIAIFLGAVLTLGSMSFVSDIIGGIVLTYSRNFQVGDFVRISDMTGNVLEKTFLSTRIVTNKNEIVSLPNGKVLGDEIINYSMMAAEGKLVLYSTITLGYDVPWRQVHEVLKEAALATEHLLPTPEPFVLQKSLDDFYVSYEINAFTDDADRMPLTYSELHQNIQDKCNEAGIEILSPEYQADRDGNESTIPMEYRQKPLGR